MSVSVAQTEVTGSVLEEISAAQAHSWALGVTVAESVLGGTPVIAAIESVARQSGESFSTVFEAACRVAANPL